MGWGAFWHNPQHLAKDQLRLLCGRAEHVSIRLMSSRVLRTTAHLVDQSSSVFLEYRAVLELCRQEIGALHKGKVSDNA